MESPQEILGESTSPSLILESDEGAASNLQADTKDWVSTELEELQKMDESQKQEAEQFAIVFLQKVVRLKGVKIDRAQFLRAELQKRAQSPDAIELAILTNPVAAGIDLSIVDQIAKSSVDFETRKSTAISFASGLPGGFTILATIPADITQFYVHAFRVMQKLAYTYGWQDFLGELDDADDETIGLLAAFLGVMMGVTGATQSVTMFASQIARPAIAKKVTGVALTKTAWYPLLKKTLRVIGIKITKDTVGKAAGKVVPVIGGVISGGLTFVALASQSNRLRKYLRELPPPNVDAAAYTSMIMAVDESNAKTQSRITGATQGAGRAFLTAATVTADKFRSVDLDGDGIPDEAVALTKVKSFGGAIAGSSSALASNLGGKLKRKRISDALETEAEVDAGPPKDGELGELKAAIEALTQRFQNEEIDALTFANQMMVLTSEAKD